MFEDLVQSVKSIHQYYRFFGKELSIIFNFLKYSFWKIAFPTGLFDYTLSHNALKNKEKQAILTGPFFRNLFINIEKGCMISRENVPFK